ncbi:hypothetical protein EQV77_15155 [Halobacillus fulvus]|nr:hypothetical protein EQV77_15155 [Halobacillus fulvus]
MYQNQQYWQDWLRYQYGYQRAFPPQMQQMNEWPVQGYYQNGYQVPYGYSPYMNGYNGTIENENFDPAFHTGAAPKGWMNYFQNEEGQLDFDKMMSTTGQVVKTVQQVSPIVKGIGSFVKGIK